MDKKIFFALAILAAVLVSATFVCAGESVEIDGIKFNIPDGYKEDADYATVDEVNNKDGVEYVTNGKLYEKGNTIVTMLVADYNGYDVTDELVSGIGGDAKTINGVDGYIKKDTIYTVFSFEKDGKLVSISATDENAIGDFLA